jgi:hypothetical protein
MSVERERERERERESERARERERERSTKTVNNSWGSVNNSDIGIVIQQIEFIEQNRNIECTLHFFVHCQITNSMSTLHQCFDFSNEM